MTEQEKQEMIRLQEIEARQKKRNKSINEHIKNNYDRMNAIFPKGTKERIKEKGFSLNDFIVSATLEKLDRMEKEK